MSERAGMRVLTQFSDPIARTLAQGLAGRTLHALMDLYDYDSRNVVIFVGDERLRYEPDGLMRMGYGDPGPFDRGALHTDKYRGDSTLFDGHDRQVTLVEGVIADAQLSLDLAKERRQYGENGEPGERPLVAKIIFEIRLTDGRAYELVSDGEETFHQQTDGFGVGPS